MSRVALEGILSAGLVVPFMVSPDLVSPPWHFLGFLVYPLPFHLPQAASPQATTLYKHTHPARNGPAADVVCERRLLPI